MSHGMFGYWERGRVARCFERITRLTSIAHCGEAVQRPGLGLQPAPAPLLLLSLLPLLQLPPLLPLLLLPLPLLA